MYRNTFANWLAAELAWLESVFRDGIEGLLVQAKARFFAYTNVSRYAFLIDSKAQKTHWELTEMVVPDEPASFFRGSGIGYSAFGNEVSDLNRFNYPSYIVDPFGTGMSSRPRAYACPADPLLTVGDSKCIVVRS